MTETLQRKLPKQERSRQRYQHILETAAHLFETQGLEAVTTNHIAAEADVSIGSLYQFFPNKEAIIEALIEGFMAEIKSVFPQSIDTSIPVETFTRGVIQTFIDFEVSQTGFKAIFLGDDNSPTALEMKQVLISQVARVLKAYYPHLPEDACQRCALVSVSITKGLMPLAAPPYALSQADLLDEIHRAVVSYQQAFVAQYHKLR